MTMKKLFILATFATVASTMYTTFDQWKQTANQYLGIPLGSSEPHPSASHASDSGSGSHGDHAVQDAHANHASGSEHAGGHHAKHKIFVTSPVVQDVTLTAVMETAIMLCIKMPT